MKTKRILYAGVFLALLITEVLIALFVHDKFIRPYFGDVLITVLLCAFVRIFFPKGIRLLPLYVFLFAVAVEFGQYFRMVELLGLADIRFFAVLMGTSFSWYDIVCYGVGCVAFAGIDYLIAHKKRT